MRFYYPDVSVTYRPNPQTDSFQDEPTVIAEVLSRYSRRIDDGEKKGAYLTIPSLSVYILIEQELPAAIVYRRTDQGIVRETHAQSDDIIPLAEIGVELPFGEIYESVEFSPEPT